MLQESCCRASGIPEPLPRTPMVEAQTARTKRLCKKITQMRLQQQYLWLLPVLKRLGST